MCVVAVTIVQKRKKENKIADSHLSLSLSLSFSPFGSQLLLLKRENDFLRRVIRTYEQKKSTSKLTASKCAITPKRAYY